MTRAMVGLVVVLLVVPSCGKSDVVALPAPSASAQASASPASAWNLVAMGDSNVSGWGVRSEEPYSPDAAFPGVYAKLLGAEQGVSVNRHSFFPDQLSNEVRTLAQWNDVLASDQALRNDLTRANVVIVLIGYHNVVPALLFNDCGLKWGPLRECLKAATKTMPADFHKLFGSIQGLVPPGTTVLAGDYGIPTPLFDQWSNEPFWPEMKKVMYEDWRTGLEAAANANGVTVVHTYAALNGPIGDKPTPADLTTDGWHFSAKGHELLAQIFMKEDGISAP